MIIGKIIIDIASSLVDKVFDYILPDESFEIGMRVYVPFGKIIKEGYIVDISNESDYDKSNLKTVLLHCCCRVPPFSVQPSREFVFVSQADSNA